MPVKKPIASARSQCGHCQTTLLPLDLIPLLSFLFLRGRCRHCQEKIPPSHFWFEIAGGIVLVVLHMHYGREPAIFFHYALIYSTLFLMSAVDVHYLYFPDRCQLALLLLLFFSVDHSGRWPQVVLGGLVFLLLLCLTDRIAPDGLGGGDKKLLLIFSLTLGMQRTLTILFWASAACLVVFCIRGIRSPSSSTLPLPFGPFLAASFFCVQEGFLSLIS